jgi:hypothetical protein
LRFVEGKGLHGIRSSQDTTKCAVATSDSPHDQQLPAMENQGTKCVKQGTQEPPSHAQVPLHNSMQIEGGA